MSLTASADVPSGRHVLTRQRGSGLSAASTSWGTLVRPEHASRLHRDSMLLGCEPSGIVLGRWSVVRVECMSFSLGLCKEKTHQPHHDSVT